MNIKDSILSKFNGKQYSKWAGRAKQFVDDPQKGGKLLSDVLKKADHTGTAPFEEIWEKVQLLFGVFGDWVKGRYKEVPKGSISMIAIGLVYFLSPLDIIPDWILGAGLFDDAIILGFIIKQINADLEKYKVWKRGAPGPGAGA